MPPMPPPEASAAAGKAAVNRVAANKVAFRLRGIGLVLLPVLSRDRLSHEDRPKSPCGTLGARQRGRRLGGLWALGDPVRAIAFQLASPAHLQHAAPLRIAFVDEVE